MAYIRELTFFKIPTECSDKECVRILSEFSEYSTPPQRLFWYPPRKQTTGEIAPVVHIPLYENFWIKPQQINLGLINDDVVEVVHFYNNHIYTPRDIVITSFVKVGSLEAETLTLSTPTTLKPLGWVEANLIVPREGEAIVNGEFDFFEDSQYLGRLLVKGVRAYAPPFLPTEYEMTIRLREKVVKSWSGRYQYKQIFNLVDIEIKMKGAKLPCEYVSNFILLARRFRDYAVMVPFFTAHIDKKHAINL